MYGEKSGSSKHAQFPKEDGIIETPLEKLSLHSKYSILPPLRTLERIHSPKIRRAETGEVSLSINTTFSTNINKSNNANNDKIVTGAHLNHQKEGHLLRRDASDDIRESGQYIDYLIRQNKEESKKKDNGFDLLVAQLVNDCEKDRRRVKSPKKRSAERKKSEPSEKQVIKDTIHGRAVVKTPRQPRETSQLSLSLDSQTLNEEINDEIVEAFPKTERTVRERPKSARYGGRSNLARPKTGYGRRKINAEITPTELKS